MRVRTTAKWSLARQRSVPKGLLALEYDPKDRERLWRMLGKLDAWQREHGEERELDLTLEVHYKKRSLDQNALLWALYEVKADVLNGGRTGPGTITAEQLYEADIRQYAKVATVIVPDEYVRWIRSEYRFVVSEEQQKDADGKPTGLTVMRFHISSSHWTSKQMHDWIEGLFDELAAVGVGLEKSDDLKRYWVEWRQHVNDTGMEVEGDRVLTGAEYKELHKICEATGEYLIVTDETGKDVHVGDLAHIKARGMGGNPEAEKDSAANWLVLKHEVHIKQHEKGWKWFVREYPHLRKKIEAALSRDVGPTEEPEEQGKELEIF